VNGYVNIYEDATTPSGLRPSLVSYATREAAEIAARACTLKLHCRVRGIPKIEVTPIHQGRIA
jgi:hypothetical protein